MSQPKHFKSTRMPNSEQSDDQPDDLSEPDNNATNELTDTRLINILNTNDNLHQLQIDTLSLIRTGRTNNDQTNDDMKTHKH